MIATRRLLPTRGLLLAAVSTLSCVMVAAGCDTSPVVASVDGHQINQTVLDAQLKAVSTNKAFVASFDANQTNQSNGLRIIGDAAGTYGTGFVAEALTGLVQDTVERQYLAAHHHLPDAALLAAVSGLEAASYRSLWLGFPSSYRRYLTQRVADLAEFVPVSGNASALRTAASAGATYLYSQVCVRQIGVSVAGSNGQVDYQASRAQAVSLIQQNELDNEFPGLEHAHSIGGGVVTCYTPEQLQGQGEAFYERVLGLGVNKVTAPIKTSFGYQLYAVTSRTLLPFDADLERATSLIVDSSSGNGLNLPFLSHLLATSKVQVNPQYGTWVPSRAALAAPTTLGANSAPSGAG